MSEDTPSLVVLAGPNGAGKSSYFEIHLRRTGIRFVNADLIARAISGAAPIDAAASVAATKAADLERRKLLERRESFCMETVFSDPVGDKLAFLSDAREAGYRVVLIFIGLSSPELSQARVIGRVAEGGHDVPDEKIFGRYPRTLENLRRAVKIVEQVLVLDNSDMNHPHRLVLRIDKGRIILKQPPIPPWLEL